jgi:hypothetical protein
MEEHLTLLPAADAEALAVAAQPFGPVGTRLSGCFRRIFSRNETRRAVAVLAGEPYANLPALEFAIEALRDRCDVVLGLSPDSRLTLFGCTSHQPGLLDGPGLAESHTGGWSPGILDLLDRLRSRGLRHEILSLDLA